MCVCVYLVGVCLIDYRMVGLPTPAVGGIVSTHVTSV